MGEPGLSWSESALRRSFREELQMRVMAMEVALLYAGNAEAVAAVFAACPAIVRGQAGQKTLFRAGLFHMTDVLQALLEGGADPNGSFGRHQDGSTPLHAACYGGHLAGVETLLRGGACVNVTCKRGFTPLHAAVLPDHAVCARSLLRAGADCAQRDAFGHMPVCYAVQNGNAALARELFEHHVAALARSGKTLHDAYDAASPKCRHDLRKIFAAWGPPQ